MKFYNLNSLITSKANNLRELAGYDGAWDDGGQAALLGKLRNFKDSLIKKHDLRPSEFNKLNDIEVGEPEEFYQELLDYKMSLARNIKL